VEVYRKSFDAFWTWAIAAGVDDPDKVDHLVINRWTDHILVAPMMRNGRPVMVTDPSTGEPAAPKATSPGRLEVDGLRDEIGPHPGVSPVQRVWDVRFGLPVPGRLHTGGHRLRLGLRPRRP
jgi:hypothetical protein